MSSEGIVGRAAELAAIAGFLSGAVNGSLLLDGEAGAGKTTLWRHAVAELRAGSARLLTARAAVGEAGFSYAALGDLLEGLDGELDALAEPQRRALRVALSLESGGEEPLEERVVALGVLNLLRRIAHEGPVVVALDDVQWLDRASAAALAFAARRLRDARVRFVVTRRSGEGGAPVLPEPVTVVTVGPLSLGALQRVLAERVGIGIPRQALRRLWEISGGNAFYALELAQALARRDGTVAPGEVTIPTDLSDLLRERLATLSPETRATLLTTALLTAPTLELLDAVEGPGAWRRLEPAAAARVVELDGSRVRFAHPLLAAAVASSGDPARKREAHRKLAALVRDPEERARNLASSVDPPDETVAAQLDEAVAYALSRGASYAAAELAQEALRFTDPGGDTWLRRVFADCECRLRIGDTEAAAARLRELLDTLPPGPERARAFLLLVPSTRSGLTRDDVERALADADGDARLRALIMLEAMGSYSIVGLGLLENVAETAATLTEAVELARSIGDAALENRARVDLAWTEYAHGRLVDPGLRPVTELGVLHELLLDPDRLRASQTMCRGDFAESARLLAALRDRAVREEEEFALFVLTLQLFDLEARRGDWPRAAERLAELEVVSAGIGAARAALLRCRAQLAAVRGDRAAADEAVSAVLASPDASGWQRLYALHVAGLAALAAGAAKDAVAPLRSAADAVARAGFRDPGPVPVVPDLVEALVLAGLRDEAARQLEWLESVARELDHPWGLAQAARGRGLVHDDEEALAEAAARSEGLGMPFDRGRALLALGRLQLRGRRRTEARRSLLEALALFEELDVPPWAERARGELARIGGRTASPDDLTPAERRVAELVAEGRTNREAAATLFLSENTIESTLRRVYRKLGVRSRTELARRFTSA